MRALTAGLLCALVLGLAGGGCRGQVEQKGAAGAGAPGAAAPAAGEGKGHVAEVVAGKFNVAFVYVGPIGDGGWTFAHDQGRQYLEKNVPDVHTAYLENVAEGADAEQAVRSLARKGFNLIITTSFGFMDATGQVATEFPRTKFLHVSGFRKNETNFGNLMGAMESMRYLAGMAAGARAEADGSKVIGAVEPFPIAEVIRLVNAFALGVRATCAECEVHLRWTHSWFDPVKEKEAAQSLLEAGADVVATGCDSPAPIVAAAQAKKWGIGYDSMNACAAAPDSCLTATYWEWGPTYAKVMAEIRAGTWRPSDLYPDADSGLVALLGFEEGQVPARGIPEDAVAGIREKHAQFRAGKLSRFDVFAGPLTDNQGRTVLAAGERLTQEDLEGLRKVPGRPDCTHCINEWLVAGVVGAIPAVK